MACDPDFESHNLSEFTPTELDAVDRVATWLATRPGSYAHATYFVQPGSTEVHVCESTLTGSTIHSSPAHEQESTLSDTAHVSGDCGYNDSLLTDAAASVNTVTAHIETNLVLGDESMSTVHYIASPSPYDLFRARRKIFSVSDLVAPAWCEVQFDYRLRHRERSRQQAQRPKEFLSADNKRIRVDQDIATRNADTMKGGSIVHENLERRFRSEPQDIQTVDETERWTVRVLKIIVCLNDIRVHGICREMPTFGLLSGHVVSGFIDEVERRLIPDQDATRPDDDGTAIQAQATRLAHMSTSEGSTSIPLASRPTSLYLSDTKTRRRDDLPSEADSLPARLQLMIYRRLLGSMISPIFPWAVFWDQLDIDPAKVLDDEFLAQVSQNISPAELQNLTGRVHEALPNSLDGFVQSFQAAIQYLEIVEINPALSIVYRSQRSARARQNAVQEAEKLQAILEAQLMEEDGAVPELARLVAKNMAQDPQVVRSFNLNTPNKNEDGHASDESESRILGTSTFVADDNLLETHLNSVFAWWMGYRPPEGVSVEDTRRCHACEFMGGSSGGESALVAFHGSPLGVGTDIGGSIRTPASFTGLWALRPSIGRVPYRGANNSFLGQEAVQSTAGPLCHSPADIRLFMQSVLSTQPWLFDPACLPIPWRSEAENLPDKLCFAVATGDDLADSLPPLRRAVFLTRNALERAGHKVIEWQWADHQCARAREIVLKMWTADGGEDVRRQLEVTGETLPEEIVVNTNGTPQTVYETWQNQYAAQNFRAEFLAQWQATAAITGTGRPIDGLIMPCTPFPAKPHGGRYILSYSFLVPLMDASSGVFPVTRVDQKLDVPRTNYEPFSEIDKRVHESYAGPENYWNVPVGLQLVGRRLEEEKIVGMLAEIEKALTVAGVHP